MFREMRRKNRELSQEAARELLQAGSWGTLATQSADGWPSATPLSYVAQGDCIYFHCAQEGLKTDNLRGNPQVCFTVVSAAEAVYSKGHFTASYASVMAYGKAQELTQPDEKAQALAALCQKYLPAHSADAPAYIEGMLAATAVWRIDILRLSGKQNKV